MLVKEANNLLVYDLKTIISIYEKLLPIDDVSLFEPLTKIIKTLESGNLSTNDNQLDIDTQILIGHLSRVNEICLNNPSQIPVNPKPAVAANTAKSVTGNVTKCTLPVLKAINHP